MKMSLTVLKWTQFLYQKITKIHNAKVNVGGVTTVSELTVPFIGYHWQVYREYKYSLITSSRKSSFLEVFVCKILLHL